MCAGLEVWAVVWKLEQWVRWGAAQMPLQEETDAHAQLQGGLAAHGSPPTPSLGSASCQRLYLLPGGRPVWRLVRARWSAQHLGTISDLPKGHLSSRASGGIRWGLRSGGTMVQLLPLPSATALAPSWVFPGALQ